MIYEGPDTPFLWMAALIVVMLQLVAGSLFSPQLESVFYLCWLMLKPFIAVLEWAMVQTFRPQFPEPVVSH